MESALKPVDGVIAKEHGSISGQRGKTYCDVINAMFKCNLSCNDVQENEICLNGSCKSHDGDETRLSARFNKGVTEKCIQAQF